MTETRSREAAALEDLGKLLRDTAPAAATLQDHLEGRARLIAAVARAQRRARLRRPALVALSFAAAAAVIALVGVRLRAPAAPLAWHVEGSAMGEGGYVSPGAGGAPARLVFSDGSLVEVLPGARGRVAATTAAGAQVVLEDGRARVKVQHRDHADWSVAAGPFSVHVTGTELLLAWAVDAEVLDLWMQTGRVSVTGPALGEPLALGAGQHLQVRVREATAQIDASEAPTGSSEVVAPAGTPTGALPPELDAGSATIVGPAAGPSWSKLVIGGDYARVLREARDEGTSHALAARPMADLRALGDAARYAGDAATAKRAYLALRARFATSGDARTAAFLLGRTAEEQEHASSDALRWYDRYLAEAPGGAFAGDALGRKMALTARDQGRDAARPLAERYLKAFPQGPYAAAARDLAP